VAYGDRDSRAGFSDVYHAFHMLSPWLVGRIGSVSDADNFYNVATVPDVAECNAHGIDYQPCVLPGGINTGSARTATSCGGSSTTWSGPACRASTSRCSTSTTRATRSPRRRVAGLDATNAGLLALDEDGTACSSDYYLRLTGDGGRMLKADRADRHPPHPAGGRLAEWRQRHGDQPARASQQQLRDADNGGSSPLIANRTAIGAGSSSTNSTRRRQHRAARPRQQPDRVADNAGASALIANRTTVGTWETFQLVHNSNGTVSLRALANNQYVTAETPARPR